MVMAYNVVVYTNPTAITNPFKGQNLHSRLVRRFLSLQAYDPELKVITGITNMVADALSRNIPIGAITNKELSANFTLPEPCSAQRDHPVWREVIYALESGDVTYLSDLPIPFAQFSYQRTTSFYMAWPTIPIPVEQLVFPGKFVPVTPQLVHDAPITGHPRRVNTLSATRHTCC